MASETAAAETVWRRRLLAALVVAASTAITLAAIEVALRLAAPASRPLAAHYAGSQLDVKVIREPSAGIAYYYEPEASALHCFDRLAGRPRPWDVEAKAGDGTPIGCLSYEVSARGFREPDAADEGSAEVIVALGDSFTFGEGVRLGERYSDVLGDLLEKRAPGRVVVHNRGVQGSWLEAQLALYLARIRYEQPSVVILGVVLNDAKPLVESDGKAENYWRPEFRTAGEARAHTLRTVDFVTSKLNSIQNRRALIDEVERSFDDVAGRRYDTTFARLAAEVMSDGARLIVLVFPMSPALDGPGSDYPFHHIHARIAGLVEAAGCELVNLLPDVEDWPREQLWAHPTDPHPSPELHALAARRLVEQIETAPTGLTRAREDGRDDER